MRACLTPPAYACMRPHWNGATMATRSWEDVELPILEEVVGAHQETREAPDTDALAERTGLDEVRVVGAVRALLLSEHVEAIDASTMAGEYYMRVRPLKPARQATGAWPSQDALAVRLT